MSETGLRRSRMAWPVPATAADAAYADLYRRKRRIHLLLWIAVLVLALAVGTLTFFVYQQQQYIEGKGEQRDREREQSQENLRRAMCDLLDTFPEGVPSLERARAKYECGPGIPRNLLTPEEQARLDDRMAPAQPTEPAGAASAPSPGPQFEGGAPVSPAPGTDTFRAPPAQTTPPPAPSATTTPPPPPPSPLEPLEPLTEPACDALGVCLEGN